MTNHFLLKIIITLFNYARCMKLAHVIYLLCIQSSKAMLLVSIPRSERGSYIWRCNFYAIYMKSVTTNTTIIWRLHWPSFVVRGGCKSIIGYATGIKHNQRTCDVKNHHSSYHQNSATMPRVWYYYFKIAPWYLDLGDNSDPLKKLLMMIFAPTKNYIWPQA
jgi:hypothetical protein